MEGKWLVQRALLYTCVLAALVSFPFVDVFSLSQNLLPVVPFLQRYERLAQRFISGELSPLDVSKMSAEDRKVSPQLCGGEI